MGFWSDVGDFGKSLVTGRWTGGENSVGDIWNRDPWAIAAPVAALATGGLAFGAGGLGAAAGLGAAELGAEAGAEGALAYAPELAAGGGEALPEWLAAPTAGETVAGDFEALGYGPASGNVGQVTAPMELASAGGGQGTLDTLPGGSAFNTAGPAPLNLSPTTGGGAPGAAGTNWWETLTSPSKWTLGGVAQGGAAALGAGGLAANLMRGNSKGAAEDRLTNIGNFGTGQAQAAIGESNVLRSYLQNGTLPAGLQAQVDQSVKAAKARLIANAGKNGVSTDPSQNTALAQDIQAAEMMGVQMAATLEQQLYDEGQKMLTQGLNFAGLSAKMYETLAGFDRTDTANLNQAIANLSGALAKSSGGINLKIA